MRWRGCSAICERDEPSRVRRCGAEGSDGTGTALPSDLIWRLDRLGRSLRYLVTLLKDVQSFGIAFVSLAEGVDATTPAGKP